MKKQLLAVILAALMTGTVLGGCGADKKDAETTSKSGDASTAEKKEEPKKDAAGGKIKMRYTGWGAPNEKKTTQNVINAFEKENPGVTVEYIHIPADYNTKLTTMITANQGPDVALCNGDLALQWAEQDKLTNIMDNLATDDTFKLDDILPQTVYWWDEGKACGVNGAYEALGLFYNKDLFETAGITVPTTADKAWTWDEFLKICQQLTIDNNGNTADSADFDAKNVKQFGLFAPSGNNAVSYASAYSQTPFLSEDGTKLNLTGTKTVEALQNIADLTTKYHVSPSPVQSKNIPGGATALASKKVAMMWDGQWALQELSANKVNFGVGIPPKMYDTPYTITMGEPVVAFKTTKYPEEAWKLQKEFMNPESTMELLETGLWMPVLKKWYTDPTLVAKWAEGNPAHPEGYVDAILNNGFENGVPNILYTVRNLPKINAILNPALDKVWLGESTVADAISSVEEKINAEVKGEFKRPE